MQLKDIDHWTIFIITAVRKPDIRRRFCLMCRRDRKKLHCGSVTIWQWPEITGTVIRKELIYVPNRLDYTRLSRYSIPEHHFGVADPEKLGSPFLLRMLKKILINPPEAIPLSDRPGHFFSIRFLNWSASGHTTVSQTVFFFIFFKSRFRPKCQWPYHSLSDQVFLKRYFRLGCQWPYHGLADRVRGMVTDVLGQKSDKKNPVCETVV